MKKIMFLFFVSVASTHLFAQSQKKYPTIDIPYKKFTLENGLTLILCEDHKIPMATFNSWYQVGSKNEKTGKTGFNHLFEHIMFTGSGHCENFDKIMQTVGGGSNNGTTNNDRTNFFENFTSTGLDRVLRVESDRMVFLLNGLDSAKAEIQRGVVQNQKRQGDNRPYSIAEELTIKRTYPGNHPYSWSVIASLEDLAAASLDDGKQWFKNYYGPNNAIMSIAGDVNTDELLQKVKKYFGDIPASPPIAKHSTWIAKISGTHVQTAQDRVPQARLQKTWNVPAWGTKEITYLDLSGAILTNGASSRLYKRLGYDEQLCTDVWSYNNGSEISQQFNIGANAKPGVSLDKVNSAVNEELKKFVISAALLSPPPSSNGYVAMQLMNTMLGGSFLSLINMNLREDKHWSYGAGAYFFETKTQGLYISYAPVQTDKTKESIVELQKELIQVTGTRPIAEDEFKKQQTATLLKIRGGWETNGSIRSFLENTILYKRDLIIPAGIPPSYKTLR